MDETRKKLYVERDGFWTEASMLFIALAAVFRLIGSIGRWEDTRYLLTQVALPVFSCLLFLLCLLFIGKKAFWATVIPVVLGVVFFIFRIMGVENEWQIIGCIVLYVVIAVLYAMTFSMPMLKWALVGILALAFLFHVLVLDVPVLMDLEHPVSFVDGMQEMSVLGIILSLLCASVAMKYPRSPAAPEQQPKPIAPEQQPKPVAPEQQPRPIAPEQQPKPAAPEQQPKPVAPEQQPKPVAPEAEKEEPALTPAQQQEPEQTPIREETLPPVSHVPIQELGFVAEPAPAFPVEDFGPEEERPSAESSTENL